jgi:hypothetical protein
MTALETWIVQLAEQIAPDDAECPRHDQNGDLLPTTLVQRVSIGLLQARAKECRSICGELQIQGVASRPDVQPIFAWLVERSSLLERMALGACTKWPLDTEPAPKKLVVMP